MDQVQHYRQIMI